LWNGYLCHCQSSVDTHYTIILSWVRPQCYKGTCEETQGSFYTSEGKFSWVPCNLSTNLLLGMLTYTPVQVVHPSFKAIARTNLCTAEKMPEYFKGMAAAFAVFQPGWFLCALILHVPNGQLPQVPAGKCLTSLWGYQPSGDEGGVSGLWVATWKILSGSDFVFSHKFPSTIIVPIMALPVLPFSLCHP
jgi:hypothetical protein